MNTIYGNITHVYVCMYNSIYSLKLIKLYLRCSVLFWLSLPHTYQHDGFPD